MRQKTMELSRILSLGSGRVGGKASGLFLLEEALKERMADDAFPMRVDVPGFSVIDTSYFRDFVSRNDLQPYAVEDVSDDRIANAFLRGSISPVLSGDLWRFISDAHEPVAVRSSSLLEDDLKSPLAGIYQTKMIPNNQPSDEIRFRKLMEAIKLVWASTYFAASKEYHAGLGTDLTDEAMAVVLQQIVGRRYSDRFYPVISGVGRSYNYYAFARSRPEDGVVMLALGLGKTVVDGDHCWSYNPEKPMIPPPFGSPAEMMKNTQNSFWCVNMGRTTDYNPLLETEYMLSCQLEDADYDNTLRLVASTYLPGSDRLVSGTGREGPRVVNFSPVLQDRILPLNETLREVMKMCQDSTGSPVEIEFAMRGPSKVGDEIRSASLSLLQVRPVTSMEDSVDLTDEDLDDPGVLAVSKKALGNGEISVSHVIFVKPETFKKSETRRIAGEIAAMNRIMSDSSQDYLLIGFGRWGSTDPWLGIPVRWGNISRARAIIEISGSAMRVELSQGSHFFHNLSSLGVAYLSVNEALDGPVRLDRILQMGDVVHESENVLCVRISEPARIRIDGKKGIGVFTL